MATIPFLLEAAAVLAAFIHPNHIAYLCSWGLTHLPPTCNSKLFGYMPRWFTWARMQYFRLPCG
ncbi:hypothetical protein DM586_00060 [Vibrio fluvialis]|nr:hypothetical protein DM586_00060 [Vibrio fluvialis]